MTLSMLKPGQTAVIEELLRNDDFMSRLMELGLNKGEKVTLVKKAPLGDPLEIRVLNYTLSIRKSEADWISVKVNE